jgi:hypothetical protein
MGSSTSTPVLLKRIVIDSSIVESKVLIGKNIVNIRSTFEGNKGYSDILFDLASRKLSA